jgi:hypothetical protein
MPVSRQWVFNDYDEVHSILDPGSLILDDNIGGLEELGSSSRG